MTDTEQPEPEDPNVLTLEMQQRAAALTEARFVLAANAGIVLGGQKIPDQFGVQDLLTVADYILGVGPFVPLSGDEEDDVPATAELPTLIPANPAFATGEGLEDDSYVPLTRDWDPPKD